MSFQLETPRLLLREMTPDDYPALCEIMQDDAVMYAYEGAFDEQETQAWLEEQLTRYEQLGFGLWAVVLKETGEMIGQCGLTLQNWKGKQVLEIGYLFQKPFGIGVTRSKLPAPAKHMRSKRCRPKRYSP